ncbi:TIM barrel protein [Providencia burhodogranariea]|uniref:Hydroxypyruvate isomerase n=1 Tax=Providencia burhodogranariea DSM 19968 TaxID=1141662 RepID=K8WQQ1_9GAMM|nr:TIM barrel protein [Providencia burhodogranariea]EKT62929.1 hydroxypyruvate isomerase [Providencia burhodogranariea DSM 19968]
MLFLDLPFIERVKRLHRMGFGVEIWDWTQKNIDELIDTGAKFTSMTGYISGNLIDDVAIEKLLNSASLSIDIAKRLECPSLNLHGTGLSNTGLPVDPIEHVTGEMWLKAQETLVKLAKLGEQSKKVFTLENLNTQIDHPGTPFAKAEDTLALVRAVNSAGLKMNLDLYHAQIGEGNLIELIRRSHQYIGEIQVADVPGRKEPGSGEINYPAIARTLKEINYDGVVAMEGWASSDPIIALNAFRQAFT